MKRIIYPLLIVSLIFFFGQGCTHKTSNESENTTDTLNLSGPKIPSGVYIGHDTQKNQGVYLVKVGEENQTELIYIPIDGGLHFTEYGKIDSLPSGECIFNAKDNTKKCSLGKDDQGRPTLTFDTEGGTALLALAQVKDNNILFESLKALTYKDDASGAFIYIFPEISEGLCKMKLCKEEKVESPDKIFIAENGMRDTYIHDGDKMELEKKGNKLSITDSQGNTQTMTLVSPLFGKYSPIGEKSEKFYQIGLVDIPSGRVVFLIDDNGLYDLIPLKESWAKGAVYEHQNTIITFKGDRVSIQEDGKKINLHEVVE